MNSNTDVKKMLRHSVDVKFYIGNMIVMGSVVVGFTLLAALCAIASREPVFWLVTLPSLFIGLPMLAWDAFNLYSIFKNIDGYRFFEAPLTHAQSTWGRRMYFIVTVEGRTMETRAVFNAYGLLGPQFNEYSNANALIGYNKTTDEVVIIERK